jgi:hypothetical protein
MKLSGKEVSEEIRQSLAAKVKAFQVNNPDFLPGLAIVQVLYTTIYLSCYLYIFTIILLPIFITIFVLFYLPHCLSSYLSY